MRLVGLSLLLPGSVGLALAICTIFTLQWIGLARTTNLARTLIFASIGIILGAAGYRLVSGTWRGSWQVPHRATALGTLFVLSYAAKTMPLNVPRPHLPPLWMFATAGLALVSWYAAAGHSRT